MQRLASWTAVVLLTISFAACCKKDDPAPGDCICPAVYDPVCGSDGKTYGNYCEAQCAGVDTVACIGSN